MSARDFMGAAVVAAECAAALRDLLRAPDDPTVRAMAEAAVAFARKEGVLR